MDSSFPRTEAISNTSGPFISPTSASLSGIITFPKPSSLEVTHPFTFSEMFAAEKSVLEFNISTTAFNISGVSGLKAFAEAFSL